MTRRALITATAVLVALGSSPAAAPHGGGGAAKGYTSTVNSVTPALGGLDVVVLDADDRLQLEVAGNHVVIIDGYEKEPYLRFSPDGVQRNRRSPATYLNDDRYGAVELPAEADPDAPPDWETVAPPGRPYDWHDHRIHWMSASYPPVVSADKSVAHRIFDWTVPGSVDAKPLTIRGTLDYAPPPGQRFPVILLVPLAVLIVAGVGLVVVRRR